MTRTLLLAFPALLASCGGIVIVEDAGEPRNGPDGEVLPLPENGSSPGDGPGDGPGWTGWWVRFPSYSAFPTALSALGEDVVVVGNGPAGDLDLGNGLLAPEVDSAEDVSFIARFSKAGELLWSDWSMGPPFHAIAVDTNHRVHVGSARAVHVYDEMGSLLETRVFSESPGSSVGALAPTADGGLLVGIEVDGEVDLGDGPIDLLGPPPLTLVARFDSNGHPLWWREITGPSGFEGIGENGAGQVLAAVTGEGFATLGDLQVGPTESTGTFAFVLDPGGSPLAGTSVSGQDATTGVATKDGGLLLSSTVVGATPLWVNGVQLYLMKLSR